MHRWRTMKDGSQTLLIGSDNFPLAIPLKKNATGQWFFDTAAGKDEMLNRRIGRNELAVINVCRGLVYAQADYHRALRDGSTTPQYALKFLSDPGRQNGLYWKSENGQPESPLGPAVTLATAQGYSAAGGNGPIPFHGYFFHMLTAQTDKAPGGAKDYIVDGKMVKGFAFVAYPACVRQFRHYDLYHQPGRVAAAEGSGIGHGQDRDRDEQIRSRQRLGPDPRAIALTQN